MADRKGFVWDTTSRSDPTNTSPEASDYSNVEDVGVLANGAYAVAISSLPGSTTHYFRAFGYDESETQYIYGSELSFTTFAPAPPPPEPESYTIGEKEIKTKWPIVEGNQFGTTKTHLKKIHLVPTKQSNIKKRNQTGL